MPLTRRKKWEAKIIAELRAARERIGKSCAEVAREFGMEEAEILQSETRPFDLPLLSLYQIVYLYDLEKKLELPWGEIEEWKGEK